MPDRFRKQDAQFSFPPPTASLQPCSFADSEREAVG